MQRLCETIAILKGVKSRTYAAITEHDKHCQKPQLFNGMTKTYEPLNDEDPDRPDGDTALIQQRTDDIIAEMCSLLTNYFDITATQETGNTIALADIVLEDGTVLVKSVPATVLLFLEKQMNDLHTALSRMPVLPPEFQWKFDPARNCWVSETVQKVRTKKQPKVVMTTTTTTTAKDGSVTEQQTGQVVQEDLPVGYWNTTYFSAALQPAWRKELLRRISTLSQAIKQARERANGVQVEKKQIGAALLDWVFAAPDATE